MSDPNATPRPIEDPFDRRQAANTSVQWVRDAFKEQSLKIDKVAEDVEKLSDGLEKSWRKVSPDEHWEHHLLFEEREKERQRLEAARLEKEAERKRFWEKIKEDILSYSLKAAGLFLIGVIVLGTQAQFKEWVKWAVTEPAAEVKK